MYQGGLKTMKRHEKCSAMKKDMGCIFLLNNFTPIKSVYKKNLAKNGTLMDSLLRVGEHHV